jgi:hypothetical protein
MLTYKECENAVSSFPKYPAKEYVWYAYKNGECQTFENRNDALTFSENVERSEVNKEIYEEKLKLYYENEQKVVDYWISEMRKEFGIPSKVFDICYSEAYDRGHAYGHDSVAERMNDIVEFAEKIIAANNENIVDAAG